MMCMEDTPKTRKPNNNNLNRSHQWQAQKEEMAKEKGLENAEDKFIESLIYHKMWDSEASWKTAADFQEGRHLIPLEGPWMGRVQHKMDS